MHRSVASVLVVLSTLVGAAGVAIAPLAAVAAQVPEPQDFEVQLGREERVLGPTMWVDMTYFSEKRDGSLKGFVSNADSFEHGVAANGTLLEPGRKVLSRGAAGRFDACGAWMLGSSFQPYPGRPKELVAFYHAERAGSADGGRCVYANHRTEASLAYIQSSDGGQTWSKSSTYGAKAAYPNNQVITQPKDLLGIDSRDDAASGRLVVPTSGDYLYLFYQAKDATDPHLRLHVARSPKLVPHGLLGTRPGGQPGDWRKRYCADPSDSATCGFTEPGIGGRSTSLKGLPASARSITWNTHLNRWVGLLATGRYGFRLWMSEGDDPTRWTARKPIYPGVSAPTDSKVDIWGAPSRTGLKSVHAYGSLIGLDGDSNTTGQEFWAYYMKVFPGEGFDKRYLMRRRARLVSTTSSPHNTVELTTYLRSGGRRVTSTEMPKPGLGYWTSAVSGRVLGAERTGSLGLFECSVNGGADLYLKLAQRVDGKWVYCNAGSVVVRRVGYVFPVKTSRATVELLRCRDSVTRTHFASTAAQNCFGKTRVTRLGWALP